MAAFGKEWVALALCAMLAVAGTVGASLLARNADTAMHPSDRGALNAPEFTVTAVDGSNVISLSQLRGKVVLLDLMASWCTACIAGMPQLVALNASYADEEFVLLSIGADDVTDNAGAVADYALQYAGTWTFAFDDEGVVRYLFDVSVYPTFVLIDAEGTILWRGQGNPDDVMLRARIDSALTAIG